MLVANIYGEAAQIEETVRSGIYDIKQKATVFFLLHTVSYQLWMIINILCSSLLCVSPAEWSVSGLTLLLMNTWIQQWVQMILHIHTWATMYYFSLQSALCCTLLSVIRQQNDLMKCTVVIRLRSRNFRRMYRCSKRNFPSAIHWWVELAGEWWDSTDLIIVC